MRFKRPISFRKKVLESNLLGLFFVDLYLQEYAKNFFWEISRYLPFKPLSITRSRSGSSLILQLACHAQEYILVNHKLMKPCTHYTSMPTCCIFMPPVPLLLFSRYTPVHSCYTSSTTTLVTDSVPLVHCWAFKASHTLQFRPGNAP